MYYIRRKSNFSLQRAPVYEIVNVHLALSTIKNADKHIKRNVPTQKINMKKSFECVSISILILLNTRV